MVNCAGSVLHPVTGALYGAASGLLDEFDWLAPPLPADLGADTRFLRPPGHPPARQLNTTIGVIITDIPLTKAQCAKMAGVGHDGLARAVRPAHSMFDGDTIFGSSVCGTTGHDGNEDGAEAASPDATQLASGPASKSSSPAGWPPSGRPASARTGLSSTRAWAIS